jgi:hypothetical protein
MKVLRTERCQLRYDGAPEPAARSGLPTMQDFAAHVALSPLSHFCRSSRIAYCFRADEANFDRDLTVGYGSVSLFPWTTPKGN